MTLKVKQHADRFGSLFLRIILANSAFAADLSGSVVSVLDGDTIEVLHNTRAERVRLNGIDCPEKGQAYGKKAKQAASALVFGKEVVGEGCTRSQQGFVG
jgi:endonuclease YncB( thermonuclease family)